ncbi:MAG TPA: ABC transporter ATP-binding protein [Thermoplasmata archaeon]|nr:ABC transporter ATP-binding protein [Thermoplasmata archaeon]
MSNSEPLLVVERLSAAWDRTPVLRDVSLAVRSGEYFVLLGPNGSGKSTLLRCLVGLERPTAGSIRLGGADVGDRPTHRRGIGLMFQDPALFGHRTVYENIAYAPLLQRRARRDVDERVGRLVQLLHLHGFEDRDPSELSGGERQRVALARTLAAEPRLVLLDEPFASIDPELKQSLRTEFRGVLAALGIAAIHVTHDREEGLFLADRVGLLFAGRLGPVGTPETVYGAPESETAARFLGYNVVRGVDGPEAIHPSDLEFHLGEDGPHRGTVEASGSLGRDRLLVIRAADGERLEVRRPIEESAPDVGAHGVLRWRRSCALPTPGDP